MSDISPGRRSAGGCRLLLLLATTVAVGAPPPSRERELDVLAMIWTAWRCRRVLASTHAVEATFDATGAGEIGRQLSPGAETTTLK